MLKVSNKLWLISDTHFGHDNIIRFAQRPKTHEVIMLSNWIERVGEQDQILHLGDVVMRKRGPTKRWLKIISRMPGEKYLIVGNHDLTEFDLYEEAGFTIIEPFIRNGVVFSHRPASLEFPPPEGDWHTNIHGHTHTNIISVEHDGHLFAGKAYINVCVEHTALAPVQLGTVFPQKWGTDV